MENYLVFINFGQTICLRIFDLCQNPISERLWSDKFNRMAGASRAGYADYRTYFYNDKEIDKQVHLGMDIASTRRAEVRAANKGKVIYADYLGICCLFVWVIRSNWQNDIFACNVNCFWSYCICSCSSLAWTTWLRRTPPSLTLMPYRSSAPNAPRSNPGARINWATCAP